MSRYTLTERVWGATTSLWLAGAVLSSASCREDEIAGPITSKSESALAATATTASLSFTQVSAGGSHTCGVNSGGQLYCWGWNGWGQLGDGTTQSHANPTLVAGGLLFRQVSVGDYHTCALTTGNRPYCWGYNGYRALGDGTTIENRLTPVPVAGSRAFRQISAGTYRTCALTTSTTNKIYCWGTGFLGNGDPVQFFLNSSARIGNPDVPPGGRGVWSRLRGIHHVQSAVLGVQQLRTTG